MSDLAIIVILIVAALVLLALEVYVPGFILGSIGIVLMAVAAYLSYKPCGGGGVAMVVVVEAVLSGIVIFISLKYFPDSRIGKRMTLATTQAGQHAQIDKPADLVGMTGVAQTPLRPAGMAAIDGKRLDVVAESGMIERGSDIRVVAVQENRIVVRKV